MVRHAALLDGAHIRVREDAIVATDRALLTLLEGPLVFLAIPHRADGARGQRARAVLPRAKGGLAGGNCV